MPKAKVKKSRLEVLSFISTLAALIIAISSYSLSRDSLRSERVRKCNTDLGLLPRSLTQTLKGLYDSIAFYRLDLNEMSDTLYTVERTKRRLEQVRVLLKTNDCSASLHSRATEDVLKYLETLERDVRKNPQAPNINKLNNLFQNYLDQSDFSDFCCQAT